MKNKINIEEIISKSMKEIWIPSWGFREPSIFEMNHLQFLNFAKSDIKLKSKKNIINALSNVKRSIDCQVDSLLYVFGHLKKSKNERWGFPKKMDFLRKMDLIGPKILEKINRNRNLLEHEYKFPKKEEVEDAIDVADLFLEATDKFVSREFYSFETTLKERLEKREKMSWIISDTVEIKFDIINNKFLFTYHKRNFKENIDFFIDITHPKFYLLLKRYILFIKSS